MKYSRQSHVIYYARYHLVICARYRRKIFKDAMGDYAMKCVKGVQRRKPEIKIEEINVDKDHMHMLVTIPPKYSVSSVVCLIKSNVARVMRKRYDFLRKMYVNKAGMWSVGYFVSTVGLNEESIRKYIEYQGREDRGQEQLDF